MTLTTRFQLTFGLFLAAMLPASETVLFAQDPRSSEWLYKGEIMGGVGFGRFYHGDDVLGNGLDLTAGFGVRPFSGALRGVGFEVQFDHFSFLNDWGNGYSYDGDVRLVSGNALYHFGRAGVQGYLVGGIGVLMADYTFANPYTRDLLNDPNYMERSSPTKMALNVGAGLKIRVAKNLSLRPDFRVFDTTIGKGFNGSHLRLSMGLSYHF